MIDCPAIALTAGLNLVSFPCAADGLTALALLRAIGNTAAGGTIQTFDTDTGRWVSTANKDGSAVDEDFPIVTGNAYLVLRGSNSAGHSRNRPGSNRQTRRAGNLRWQQQRDTYLQASL